MKECDNLDDVFEHTISLMESEGMDFREEAGMFELDYTPRPDLKIVVTVVNKQVAEVFEQHEGYH